MNRDDMLVLLQAALIALVLTLAAPAFATELCPPKKYTCWMVQKAAGKWGMPAVEERARMCGWSELQIAIARRCLK